MKISDVLRSLVDIVDKNSTDDAEVIGQEDTKVFSGQLKPVVLPDVKTSTRAKTEEKTSAGNDKNPEDLYVSPLQMKMELLKKASGVENIYDDGAPEQQEEARIEKEGMWTGSDHEYDFVGAQTGAVESSTKGETKADAPAPDFGKKKDKAEDKDEETDTDTKEDDKKKETTNESMRRLMNMLESCDDEEEELDEDKADKDYDGDGEVESEKDEVWGSRMKAAKKAGKMDESEVMRGLLNVFEEECEDEELDEDCDDECEELDEGKAPSMNRWGTKNLEEAGYETLDERGEPADEQAVRELVLFADNDGMLYRQSYEPIIKNLQRKVAKGTYDPEMAVKLWKYHADRAAQSYGKQYGDGTPWNVMFNPATRLEAARQFEEQAREEIGADSHDEFDSAIDTMESWGQMDELSKDTLGSYVKKASHGNFGNSMKDIGAAKQSVGRHMSGQNELADRVSRFEKNRSKGIDRAVDRLTREDDCQLDELSKKTLGSYVKSATRDALGQAHTAGYTLGGKHGSQDKYLDKVQKRGKGIGRAVDRLANEEQLDEGRIDPVEAYEILDSMGAIGENFFALPSDKVSELLQHAKRLGYRKGANAPGSTARMFFDYLSRLADGVAKRRSARGMGEDHCGEEMDEMSLYEASKQRMKKLAGMDNLVIRDELTSDHPTD